MANKLIISFNSIPNIDDFIKIYLHNTETSEDDEFIEVFKQSRTSSNEVTIRYITDLQAIRFNQSIVADYGLYITSPLPIDYKVIIRLKGDTKYDDIISCEISDIFASYQLLEDDDDDGLNIIGLERNGYFIDNDIWVNASLSVQGIPSRYFVNITNQQTQKSSGNIRLYPRPEANNILFNLSPVIKSYIEVISNDTDYNLGSHITKNWNNFRIRIGCEYSEGGNINTVYANYDRIFIQGGIRSQKTNVNVNIGDKLRQSVKFPIWGNYPVAEYTVNSNFQIIKNTDKTSISDKDYRRIKGCNPIYLKFKSSKGGYSYWLFEGWNNEETNSNNGIVQNNQRIYDLGNDADFRLNVYSKVPAEYYGLIEDLIISPEIYLYDNISLEWEQITSDNNKTDRDHFSKVYEVKLKFKKHLNYNPAPLW